METGFREVGDGIAAASNGNVRQRLYGRSSTGPRKAAAVEPTANRPDSESLNWRAREGGWSDDHNQSEGTQRLRSAL